MTFALFGNDPVEFLSSDELLYQFEMYSSRIRLCEGEYAKIPGLAWLLEDMKKATLPRYLELKAELNRRLGVITDAPGESGT